MKYLDGAELLKKYHGSNIMCSGCNKLHISPLTIYCILLILTTPIYFFISLGIGVVIDLMITFIYYGLKSPPELRILHPIHEVHHSLPTRDLINVDLNGKDFSNTDLANRRIENVDFTGCKLIGATYQNGMDGRIKLIRITSNFVKHLEHEGRDCYIFKVDITKKNPNEQFETMTYTDYIIHLDQCGMTLEDWVGYYVAPNIITKEEDEIMEYVKSQREN